VRPYVIRQGDYLTALAARFGFDADDVWNAPHNRELRERRIHPDILCPCDVLYIPKETRATLSVNARSVNSFSAASPEVRVEALLREGGQPLAEVDCILTGVGATLKTTTDERGIIRFAASVHSKVAIIWVPTHHAVYRLLIGHMDPIDETSGLRARLRHLGYFGAFDDDPFIEEELERAICSFQRDKGLPIRGVADARTKAELLKAHGS